MISREASDGTQAMRILLLAAVCTSTGHGQKIPLVNIARFYSWMKIGKKREKKIKILGDGRKEGDTPPSVKKCKISRTRARIEFA